jgi:hypothetical protein
MPRDRRTTDLSRKLSETQRRKRRDVRYTGANLVGAVFDSTGSTGEGPCITSCPNFGPVDAGIEQQTAQSTGTVIGHVYQDVVLADVGIIAGADLVSFCYDGRIGPSTGPIEVYCDGQFALIESGLLAKPDFSAGLGDWEVLAGTWETEQDPGGTWVLKGYAELDDFTGTFNNWALIRYKPIPDRKTAYLQFRYQRQGVGTGDYYIGDNVGGRWHFWDGDPDMQLSGNDLRVRWGQDTTASGGASWDWWKGNSNGTFGVAKELTILRPSNGKTGASPVKTNVFSMQADPVHLFVNTDSASTDGPYQYQSEWIYQEPIFNTDVIAHASAVHEDNAGHLSIAVYNSLNQTGLFGKHAKEVGYWKVYDITIMKDRAVEWQLGSSGRRVKMRAGSGASVRESYTPFPASSDGSNISYSLWRNGFSTGTAAPSGPWGANYPLGYIEVHASDAYSSTSLLATCNEALVYGGDVWAFSSGSTFSSTAGLSSTACATFIKLNFLDSGGNILSTHGSTVTTGSFAYDRLTGAEGIAVPETAVKARFTHMKTGPGDCFGMADDLQFNVGDCCCPYSPPLLALLNALSGGEIVTSIDWSSLAYTILPSSIGGYAMTRLWSTADQAWVFAEDLFDTHAEHRTAPINFLRSAHDTKTVGPTTGDADSTAPYPSIGFGEFGMSTGDRISLRFMARAYSTST